MSFDKLLSEVSEMAATDRIQVDKLDGPLEVDSDLDLDDQVKTIKTTMLGFNTNFPNPLWN